MMNKTLLLRISIIVISILIHLFMLSFSFRVEEPEEIEKLLPIFQMVDAVLIEDPVVVELPPPPEPEIIEEVNEAVIPDEKAPEPPEEEEIAEVEPIQSSEGEATDSDAASQNTETNYIPFYKVEKRPEFISRAELEYPLQAKRNRIEGTVIVEADIDENGILKQIKIVRSAGFGFDEAASAMLKDSTFSPAVMDGRRVGVKMRFTIKFEI